VQAQYAVATLSKRLNIPSAFHRSRNRRLK